MGTDVQDESATPRSETRHAPPGVTRRELLVRGGQTAAVAGLATAAAWKLYDPIGDAGLQPPPPIRLKDYFAKVDFDPAAVRLSAAFGRLDQVDRMVTAALAGLPSG